MDLPNQFSTEQYQFTERLLSLPRVFGSHVQVLSQGVFKNALILRVDEFEPKSFALWLTVRELCHYGRNLGVRYQIGSFDSPIRSAQITIAMSTPAAVDGEAHTAPPPLSSFPTIQFEPQQILVEG